MHLRATSVKHTAVWLSSTTPIRTWARRPRHQKHSGLSPRHTPCSAMLQRAFLTTRRWPRRRQRGPRSQPKLELARCHPHGGDRLHAPGAFVRTWPAEVREEARGFSGVTPVVSCRLVARRNRLPLRPRHGRPSRRKVQRVDSPHPVQAQIRPRASSYVSATVSPAPPRKRWATRGVSTSRALACRHIMESTVGSDESVVHRGWFAALHLAQK